MARVLLIDPSFAIAKYAVHKDVYPHSGLMLMGTMLRDAGHDVIVRHLLADGDTTETIRPGLEVFKPDIVAITFVTFQLRAANETARAIKAVNPNILIVGGGPHFSAASLTDHTGLDLAANFDKVVIGEGEKIMLRLAAGERFPKKYIHGEPIEDMNTLPLPDLSLTHLERFAGIYPPGPMPSMPLMYSRGCPFHCSFCSKSVFGDKVRVRAVERVLDDIEALTRKHGVREIFFQDDTFNVNRGYCEELLLNIIKRGLHKGVAYRARLRANEKLIDRALLHLMKYAGFWCIFYGVENGNQKMLESMDKHLKVEEIKRAFKLTRETGIKAEASFIIGMPGETKETIEDSFQLYHDLKPDWCSFNRAIPFPGTAFEKEVRAKGHLLYPNYEQYELNTTLVRTDALSAEELEEYADKADGMVLPHRIISLVTHPVRALRVAKDMGIKQIVRRVRE